MRLVYVWSQDLEDKLAVVDEDGASVALMPPAMVAVQWVLVLVWKHGLVNANCEASIARYLAQYEYAWISASGLLGSIFLRRHLLLYPRLIRGLVVNTSNSSAVSVWHLWRTAI